MLPRWIIEDWTRRLSALRRLAADRHSPDSWLAPLHIRVLSFLLNRYAPPDATPAPPDQPVSRPPHTPAPEFCAVTQVILTPPKAQPHIRALLRHIHALNTDAKYRSRRWRVL